MESVIFLSKPIDLSQLKCKQFTVKPRSDSNQNMFSRVTFCARDLIFSFHDLMANPHGDAETIIVIGSNSLFHQTNFNSKCEKLGLISGNDMTCSSGIIQTCINYTFLAKLAPGWNRVGSWLIRGRQFLHQVEPLPAVKMLPRLAGTEIEIAVKATNYRFPLLQPSELNVDTEIVENFMLGDTEVIPTEYIKNKSVVVLPNLTRGRLVSITKSLPTISNFKNFSQMKRYWKNMYGYRLTDNEELQPVVYYNVTFGQKNIYTYPEWTVRGADPMKIPRTDPRPIISEFINDLQKKITNVFGSPFVLHSNEAFQPITEVQVANSLDTTMGVVSRSCLQPGFPTPSHSYRPHLEINDKKLHKAAWNQIIDTPACNSLTEKMSLSGDSGYCSEQTSSSLQEKILLNETPKIKPNFRRMVDINSSSKKDTLINQDGSAESSSTNKNRTNLGVVPHFSKNNLISRFTKENTDISSMTVVAPTLYENITCTNLSVSSNRVLLPKGDNQSTLTPRFPVNNFISRFQTLSEKVNPSSVDTNIKLPITIMFPSSASSGLVFKKPDNYSPDVPKKYSLNTGFGDKIISPLPGGSRRKPSVQDVDVSVIVKEKGASGLAKVNTTTLLHYLRKEGVQGIKAKTRKEDLVRSILQHNSILSDVSQKT